MQNKIIYQRCTNSFLAILKEGMIELKTKVWIIVAILTNCLIVMASDKKHSGNMVQWMVEVKEKS